MKEVPASSVDQGVGADGLRAPIQAVRLGSEELGPQCGGAHVGVREPLGPGDFLVLQSERGRLLGGEVERETDIEVLVSGLALARIGVDVMDVHVDRLVKELRSQAQVAGTQPGLFAHLPHGRGQERTVTRLNVAGREQKPRDLVVDVQYVTVAVDDDRAAGDVAGESRAAGRVVRAVQDGQQSGQGRSLMRMPSQIAFRGRADVGASDRHVNTSGKHGDGGTGGWVGGVRGGRGDGRSF